MLKTEKKEKKFLGIDQLSLRGILIGMLGSCIITASSMYVALRMSSLPWPTIFVAILSMAILKALGNTNFNEINITQTAMSAGAMVAGGIAFTIPGLWITGVWKDVNIKGSHFYMVLMISLAGMILGTILTYLLRKKFIEEEKLPYPIGEAAAETITTGDEGGKKAKVLFGTMGLSAIFTYLRDNLMVIPTAVTSKFLYARNYYVGVWLSPMAIGIGYIIGWLYTGVWFLGSVISYLLIVPLGTYFHIFANAADAVAFKNTVGIGLMVGTGIGILISFIIKSIKNNEKKSINTKGFLSEISYKGKMLMLISTLIAFILSILCNISVIASLLLIIGVFITSAMAATITGETGINPMEVFGIIVLLAIRVLVNLNATSAFLVAGCVAVSCGYAGDLLNEYKVGYKIGTNPKAQLISQIAGGLVGTVVAAAALFAIIGQFGGVGADKKLPAGQAFAVSQMVNGIGDTKVFIIALIVGVILYLLRIPSMTLGLGMYLSFEISSAVFIGGLIRFIVGKFKNNSIETGNIAASGLLGGEGITGVAVAIIKMFMAG
ncbi:OPT/YSL family transporter [Clostridium sp. 19966]|uniref:OPT/YSL family transporter n=1 Tax=Clostridium sp. 19966 TaxID=2768166 RepID=UPI0028DD4515|nr:OPT/YSL family transporter [Clostridium sp. 19966]MDT8716271.1 OPT/YSL family transporter [Clostridium sp. 19966]